MKIMNAQQAKELTNDYPRLKQKHEQKLTTRKKDIFRKEKKKNVYKKE